MKWIKITAVFAFLLLVVNVFLLYNLSRQYANTSLINSELIDKTVLLLKKDDIYISENLIPRKKPDYKIFEGAFFTNMEEYYINTAMLLSDNKVTDDFTLHMINNGIKIKENTNGETFEFYNDNIFSFQYMKDSKISPDLSSYKENDTDKIYDAVLDDNRTGIQREIENLINMKFFNDYKKSLKNSSKNNFMQVVVKKIYFNKNQDIYIAECIQKFNGLELYECEAVCVIYQGEFIYAKGNIIFSSTGNSYFTELYDQISTLFDEKAYINQQRNQPISSESMEEDTVLNITSLKCIYSISWNADRSKYYLIPSWYIEYNGNIVRIRNAINGNIYTI